jgi:hypothetical protein
MNSQRPIPIAGGKHNVDRRFPTALPHTDKVNPAMLEGHDREAFHDFCGKDWLSGYRPAGPHRESRLRRCPEVHYFPVSFNGITPASGTVASTVALAAASLVVRFFLSGIGRNGSFSPMLLFVLLVSMRANKLVFHLSLFDVQKYPLVQRTHLGFCRVLADASSSPRKAILTATFSARKMRRNGTLNQYTPFPL